MFSSKIFLTTDHTEYTENVFSRGLTSVAVIRVNPRKSVPNKYRPLRQRSLPIQQFGRQALHQVGVLGISHEVGALLQVVQPSGQAPDPCPGLMDPSRPDQAATCNVVLDKGFAICGTLPAGPTPDRPEAPPSPPPASTNSSEDLRKLRKSRMA